MYFSASFSILETRTHTFKLAFSISSCTEQLLAWAFNIQRPPPSPPFPICIPPPLALFLSDRKDVHFASLSLFSRQKGSTIVCCSRREKCLQEEEQSRDVHCVVLFCCFDPFAQPAVRPITKFLLLLLQSICIAHCPDTTVSNGCCWW